MFSELHVVPTAADRRALARHLMILAGPESGGLLELRARTGRGMTQAFYATDRLTDLANAAVSLGARTDVYVGCALRQRRHGGRDAITQTWVLWADCDTSPSALAAQQFTPAATTIISSGTAEHVHAYWALSEPLDACHVADANRRLARVLGADGGAVTAVTAILRPPGTLNHKHDPPLRVTAQREARDARIRPGELLGVLAPLPAASTTQSLSVADREPDGDPLLQITPAAYVPALTGRALGRDSKIRCPLHDDRTPSLHAFPTAAQGWYCFGCQTGGSIYDLAGALWGMSTRGPDFLTLRDRLQRTLGITPQPE